MCLLLMNLPVVYLVRKIKMHQSFRDPDKVCWVLLVKRSPMRNITKLLNCPAAIWLIKFTLTRDTFCSMFQKIRGKLFKLLKLRIILHITLTHRHPPINAKRNRQSIIHSDNLQQNTSNFFWFSFIITFYIFFSFHKNSLVKSVIYYHNIVIHKYTYIQVTNII